MRSNSWHWSAACYLAESLNWSNRLTPTLAYSSSKDSARNLHVIEPIAGPLQLVSHYLLAQSPHTPGDLHPTQETCNTHKLHSQCISITRRMHNIEGEPSQAAIWVLARLSIQMNVWSTLYMCIVLHVAATPHYHLLMDNEGSSGL